MSSLSFRAFLLLSLLPIAACGELRQDLGLGRSPPDEFAVMERAPLSMPPDFTLAPPRPGAPRLQEIDTTQRASSLLFEGKEPPVGGSASEAEKALLIATQASKADPAIRELVDRDSTQVVEASPHLVARLLGKESGTPDTVVDAAAEAARIQKAKEENVPLSQGATPVIEKGKTGWLGW